MNRVELPGIEIHWHPLEELLPLADVLTLHCPLNDKTHHLLHEQRLRLIKPTAILINTGRGPLLDEAAVAKALGEKRLAGAAVDVLSSEPPAADNPLLSAPNCVISPHIAWATREARERLIQIAAGNIQAYLDGSPRNVVTA